MVSGNFIFIDKRGFHFMSKARSEGILLVYACNGIFYRLTSAVAESITGLRIRIKNCYEL